MNPVPSSVKAHGSAQVNLMPPEVGQRKAAGKQKSLITLALVGFVALVGGLYVVAVLGKQAAQADLAAAEKLNADLIAEKAQFDIVPQVLELRRNSSEARLYAGATDMIFAEFADELRYALPGDALFESLSYQKAQLNLAATPAEGAFATADIGYITFVAYTDEYVDAAALVEHIDASPMFDDARAFSSVREVFDIAGDSAGLPEGTVGATSPAVGPIYYQVSGTVRITYSALSHRFSTLWFGDAETAGSIPSYQALLESLRELLLGPEVPEPDNGADSGADTDEEEAA